MNRYVTKKEMRFVYFTMFIVWLSLIFFCITAGKYIKYTRAGVKPSVALTLAVTGEL